MTKHELGLSEKAGDPDNNEIGDSLLQVMELSDPAKKKWRDDFTGSNTDKYATGELHFRVRDLDEDAIGISEDYERRLKEKELKRIRRATEGGVVRRMARKILRP